MLPRAWPLPSPPRLFPWTPSHPRPHRALRVVLLSGCSCVHPRPLSSQPCRPPRGHHSLTGPGGPSRPQPRLSRGMHASSRVTAGQLPGFCPDPPETRLTTVAAPSPGLVSGALSPPSSHRWPLDPELILKPSCPARLLSSPASSFPWLPPGPGGVPRRADEALACQPPLPGRPSLPRFPFSPELASQRGPDWTEEVKPSCPFGGGGGADSPLSLDWRAEQGRFQRESTLCPGGRVVSAASPSWGRAASLGGWQGRGTAGFTPPPPLTWRFHLSYFLLYMQENKISKIVSGIHLKTRNDFEATSWGPDPPSLLVVLDPQSPRAGVGQGPAPSPGERETEARKSAPFLRTGTPPPPAPGTVTLDQP